MPLPDALLDQIRHATETLEGWCNLEKATAIAEAILEVKPATALEIGIYGGRSLVPAAYALKHLGETPIWGVDAWSNAVAVSTPTSEINDLWWGKVDLARPRRSFLRYVVEHDLVDHVRILEADSVKVTHLFGPLDYLHIDGSHSEAHALHDVDHYATKVRAGGAIVFDDTDWPTTERAMERLLAFATVTREIYDPESLYVGTGKPSSVVLRRS
jgi:cephalosporin hydroxylase